jgi:prepilin-type N-terminal cleavage/methylation domain-containing protein
MLLSMRRAGFTLLEMSIVLLIIGLLIGGMLIGKNIYRSAELKSIMQDSGYYNTAVMGFYTRYNQLPGDMVNATDFWGAANGDAVLCKTTQGAGTQTCNGNGDGLIGPAAKSLTYYERFRFWQQLANAGFIKGSFSGIAGNSGTAPLEEPVLGANVPQSKINGVGFGIYPLGDYAGTVTHFKSAYGNNIFIGSKLTNSTAGINAFTPAEAFSIDQKMDDGRPGYGIVMTHPSTNASLPDCTVGITAETAEYKVSYKQKACSLILKSGL